MRIRQMRATRLLFALTLLALSATAAAEVWKCVDAQGKASYSDMPCAGRAAPRAVDVRPAAAGITRPHAPPDDKAQTPPTPASPKICPSERDIANLETRASSITLDAKSKTFMQDELRRARACSREDTHYTREDWERIQNGIRDQDRSLASDRAAARASVRDIHSIAASSQEAARIDNEKKREQRAAHCDAHYCWDEDGVRAVRRDLPR